jgi:2-oxo-3-hexenedioate decarboxylase
MTLAKRLLAALDSAGLTPLPSHDNAAFSLRDAFAVADELRGLRIARGEKPLGYKIGFTNRGIWQRYGVHAPIWGPVWDSTTRLLDGATVEVSLAGLSQPRLEPEVVFGFARPPRAGMNLAELLDCLEWAAHGFEIVHTHFDGWRVTAPDTVADFALHGRLFVGPRCALRDWPTAGEDLAALRVQLSCDGKPLDEGVGTIVLDGPLNALRLWIDAMATHTPQWTIEAQDIVTTGTITDAWPLQAGQTWTTRLSDKRLAALTLTTTAS